MGADKHSKTEWADVAFFAVLMMTAVLAMGILVLPILRLVDAAASLEVKRIEMQMALTNAPVGK